MSTDGIGLGEAATTVVVWTCNHCPYPLAWHDRLAAAARDYAGRGMPYLHDASQEVARSYGARTTPDVFVFDANLRLRYRGAPDADHMEPGQEAAWLRPALDAVLDGAPPETAETEPVGCSIKWRQPS